MFGDWFFFFCNYACQTWICDFSPDSNLIQAKIDLEQGYKFKPNLFSVSFEVEQEQATLREDKSISATPDQLSSALQTFKKNGGNVLNEQKSSDGKRYY